MKSRNKIILLFLSMCVQTVLTPKLFAQNALPSEAWNNTSDYTFMYYPEPLTEGTEFHIQTNHHFLSFDYNNLHLKDLRPILSPLSEEEAVRKSLDFLPSNIDQNLLECVLTYNGQEYKLVDGASSPNECRLIESGKYFQRRNIINLGFEAGAPNVEATLEITSWPDRIAFILKVKPIDAIDLANLKMKLNFPQDYKDQLIEENNKYLSLDNSGNGFLYYTPSDNNGIGNVDGFTASKNFTTEENYQVELIAIPVKEYNNEGIGSLIQNETNPVTITSTQIIPTSKALTTEFDPIYGWHKIVLNNEVSGNYGMERVSMTLNNTETTDQIVHLNFSKNNVANITGISAILRDNEQNPTGIPIQISKNWHNQPDEFNGPWFRGFSMLTVPANTSIEIEFTLVNAFWGKLPAASHSQLCLVGWPGGWGSNQQWDQSAIGAFGESICYEPDGGQAQSMITDVRPLMIKSTNNLQKPKEWSWTPNVGGADFFRFYDASGNKKFIKRIKTHYKRNCPNLTEVTYAGTTNNKEADYELTTSIYRTDDYVRGVYKIKLKVKEVMNFSRLAILQVGTDTYSYTGEEKFAFGDENGLIEEWDAQWGSNSYKKTGLTTSGNTPWVSMHEAVNRSPAEWGAWANRGIIVRNWNAKVGGVSVNPTFSEYGAVARGKNTSLVELNLPVGTTQLQPGDYIEAEIVQVVIPQEATSYYGSNILFKEALDLHENTWQPVFREAVGNNLQITAQKGTVLHKYPAVVQVNGNNEATIEVVGGIGYVPITFTGLTSYRNFSLKVLKDGNEIDLNQSVYGKDFWQTDYNPVSNTWEITYSVPLDSNYEYFDAPVVSPKILYNDFDNSQTHSWSSPSSSLTFSDNITNPNTNGNLSLKVAKAIRGTGTHASVRFLLPNQIDLSKSTEFKLKVYFESAGITVPNVANFRIILREDGNGATQHAITKNITSTNNWVEYTLDFKNADKSKNYNQVWLFFASPDTNSDANGFVYYVDDLVGPALISDALAIDTPVQFKKQKFIIFPNPSKESIKINVDSRLTVIYNSEGREVYRSEFGEKIIDISAFSNGVYLLKANGKIEGIKTGFFVKA